MKKSLLMILAALFFCVALFSGHLIWRYLEEERETEEQFHELFGHIKRPELDMQDMQDAPEGSGDARLPDPEWTVYDQYGELFVQNPDMIGWIAIDGTRIDYPVMQTPDRPNFYLKRDFDKQNSGCGVPYAAEACSVDPQSDNITIYGHHMKSGEIFGVLEEYKGEAFYREHPLICFDTRAGFGMYEIIAVFKVNPADFQYNLFINATDESEFYDYVYRCKALSFYDTGVGAGYGDKLISLSTCEYSRNNNRLVVVARKI